MKPTQRPNTPTVNKFLIFLILFMAAGCTSRLSPALGPDSSQGGLEPMVNHASPDSSQPTGAGSSDYELMPYDVDGKVYRPLVKADGFQQEGIASWYGDAFHGKATSNKEVYNMHALTAAHKTLPFDTRVRVTNLENGKTVTVRINDRGPFVGDRVIDLSYKAARQLGMVEGGTAPVRLVVLESGTAPQPEPRPTRPAGRVQYSIQLGVFENRDFADQLSRQYDGQVRNVNRDGRNWYQVLVGDYPKYEDAIREREKLRGQGREDAFIIRNWKPAPAAMEN